MTLYNDMSQHPVFSEKPVRLRYNQESHTIAIVVDANEMSMDIMDGEARLVMTTDEGSLLHYLLTQALFDDQILNSGMDPDYYGGSA